MIVVLCVVFVCATTLGLAAMLRPQPTPPTPQPAPVPSVLDERLLEQVIVTLKSGTTFEGVLYVEDTGAVVLAKAQHVNSDGKKIPADGEIVILRPDIDFIQRP